jgi:hypothetical protein
MTKIIIQVDTEAEWQRAKRYANLVKGTEVEVKYMTIEERKKRIKEFLEWTEHNAVKIDGAIEIPSREERNAR